MEATRIVLDLSHIFQDYRKKAFVLIRPEWKNIESLQTKIINLFGLEHYIYLTNTEGIVYPAAENPVVIDQKDMVVVHKINANQLLAPNPTNNGNDKDNNKVLIQSSSSSDETDTIEKLKCILLPHLQKKKISKPPTALNDDSSVKRRRKRVRKRKTNENKNDKRIVSDRAASSKQGGQFKPSETWIKNPKNVHVRFSDNASSSESSSSESKSEFESPNKICKFKGDTHVVARKILPTVRFSKSQEQSIEVNLDSTFDQSGSGQSRLPNLRLDAISTTDTPIIGPTLPNNTDHLSEAEVPSIAPISTPTTALLTGSNTETLEELRKDVGQLNLPLVDLVSPNLKISDTLVFKLLRMDDQCQPTISDFIIGCIEKTNTDFSEMTIRILAGKSEVGSRICTTVLTEDNEIGVIENDQISLSFKELYEPRYCLFTM